MYLRLAWNIARYCRISQCKPLKGLLPSGRYNGTELRFNHGFHSSSLTMQDTTKNTIDGEQKSSMEGAKDKLDAQNEQQPSEELKKDAQDNADDAHKEEMDGQARIAQGKRTLRKRQLIFFGFSAAVVSAYAYYLFTKHRRDLEARIVNSGDMGGRLSETTGTGRPDIGGPFELLDHHGNTVTNSTFHGKWVLMNFGYCRCPDICPEQLDRLGLLIDELDASGDGDDVTTLFVSVDPRDDVDTMRDFVSEFHPKLLGLTGSVEQQKTVTKNFRIYFSKGPEDADGDYVMDHSIVFYLLDPAGKYASYFMGMDRQTVPEMAAQIRRFKRGEEVALA